MTSLRTKSRGLTAGEGASSTACGAARRRGSANSRRDSASARSCPAWARSVNMTMLTLLPRKRSGGIPLFIVAGDEADASGIAPATSASAFQNIIGFPPDSC